MAFTDAQKLSISKILGISPSVLDAQITALGASLTLTIEAAVIAEIARWDAGAGAKFTKIHPRERNYGVETFPDATRADIKRNIALLLEMWDTFSSSSAGMGTLQIG